MPSGSLLSPPSKPAPITPLKSVDELNWKQTAFINALRDFAERIAAQPTAVPVEVPVEMEIA